MGLWLEQRDENGQLLAAIRFINGVADSITIAEARDVCRVTAHLPIAKRAWALRIRFGEDE